MNRILSFTKRNLIELSRDMLGYIFCIAFPILMLIVMSVVNESIPKEAGMSIFRIDNLAGGVIIFGQTFVMLFTAILVTTDRSSSFLTRLFSSPMKSSDFIGGYTIPMLLINMVQSLMIAVSSLIIAKITGTDINIGGLFLTLVLSLPSAVMFIAIGMIAGSVFNEKSAPGVCSVIVSVGTFLGGVFFDAEGVGGSIYKVAKCLPFIYCTKSMRSVIRLDFGMDSFVMPLCVVLAVAAILMSISILVFNMKMKADK